MEISTKALRELHPKRYDVPALIALAAILLVMGLLLPLFKVTQMLLWKSSYSIITGTIQLFKEGELFLGTIILLFSVVFPIIKLVALSILWMIRFPEEKRKVALNWLGYLGRWSMLDVLIVALMILAIKLRALTRVESQVGVYVFCAAILVSMIAAIMVERLARDLGKQ